MVKEPIVAVNFKAYPTAFGKKGLEIAKAAEKVYKEFGGNVEIIIAPPATELRIIKENVEVLVFAQHADPLTLGSRTGWLPIELIKDTGFNSVSEYVTFMLREVLSRKDEEKGHEPLTEEDVEHIKRKLKALGYL